MVMCLGRGADFAYGPADAIAPVNLDWFHLPRFTFLVPAHLGSTGQNPRGP